MIYLKYFLPIVLFCCSIYSQINIDVIKVIDLPEVLTNKAFQPTLFNVNATGFYFLDIVNRQVTFLSNNGEVIFSGGYGIDDDAFIDPVEIFSSKLRVWIVDRTENNLIEFDHKLNYLRTIKFDQIYPEFSGIDDWGNIFLQSDQEQMILIANLPIQNFDNFIDLSLWEDVRDCINDVHVAIDGTIGVLTNCNNSLHIFNRLGNLENKFFIENTNGRFLIKLSNEWFVINNEGQITAIRYNEKVNLPIEQPILDVTQMDGSLFLLLSDKILVFDVSLE